MGSRRRVVWILPARLKKRLEHGGGVNQYTCVCGKLKGSSAFGARECLASFVKGRPRLAPKGSPACCSVTWGGGRVRRLNWRKNQAVICPETLDGWNIRMWFLDGWSGEDVGYRHLWIEAGRIQAAGVRFQVQETWNLEGEEDKRTAYWASLTVVFD